MRTAAAVVVQVFRDVGELREEAERPHDLDCGLVIERVEQLLERRLRAQVAFAAEAQGALPDSFHQVEEPRSFLLAQRVAEQPAEQADVLAQRLVLVDR